MSKKICSTYANVLKPPNCVNFFNNNHCILLYQMIHVIILHYYDTVKKK